MECPVCKDGGFEKFKKGERFYNQLFMCPTHSVEYTQLICEHEFTYLDLETDELRCTMCRKLLNPEAFDFDSDEEEE